VLANVDQRRVNSEDVDLVTNSLDNTDEDGTPLNERNSPLSGEDLDVPDLEDTDGEDIEE
jgi:hypothetical protein